MKVKELLTDEKLWTKEYFARNSLGTAVDIFHENATCFCLLGAIIKCYGQGDQACTVMEKVTKELGTGLLSEWNDSHNFSDVKELVTKLDI